MVQALASVRLSRPAQVFACASPSGNFGAKERSGACGSCKVPVLAKPKDQSSGPARSKACLRRRSETGKAIDCDRCRHCVPVSS
jgi:hypothetical protein